MPKYYIPVKKRFDGTYASEVILRIKGASKAGGPGGWGIGGWDQDTEERLVFHGPLVRGPVAYAYGLMSAISTDGGTAKEWFDAGSRGLLFDLEEGDTLVIDGAEYNLTLSGGYPKLNK